MKPSSVKEQSEKRPKLSSQRLMAEAIHKHCLLALTGQYEKLPKQKQLILISWVREANKRLIDERKRVALILEARKLGLVSDTKLLD